MKFAKMNIITLNYFLFLLWRNFKNLSMQNLLVLQDHFVFSHQKFISKAPFYLYGKK
jgi:hypothetical protein